EMTSSIRDDTVKVVLSVRFRTEEEIKREQVAKVTATSGSGDGSEKGRTVRNDKNKVGVNDPCPCGSGKKYKKCCGKPGANK
ncbi:MAG: SEC-C domain-containing protein, partial [Clostridia bacterium]|nr:SEC-C domain-containing protein [Clostridia bacterium]